MGPTPIGRSAPLNAIASSSRPALDKKPTTLVQPVVDRNMPRQTTTPSGPKSLANLSSRAREKSPMSSAPLHGGAQALTPPPETTCPPPDPRSLAHISTGPSSNPLNIRPSATFRKAVAALSAPKKRVVVGASWPLVKALHASPATPPPPSTPPPPQPAPATATSARPSNLSTILTYSSPSPPLPSPDYPISGGWTLLASQGSVSPILLTKPQKAQQESNSVGKSQPMQPGFCSINGNPQTCECLHAMCLTPSFMIFVMK